MALVSNPMLPTCMGGVLLAATLLTAAGGAEVSPPNPRLAREDQSLKAVCAKCHNLQIVMDTPQEL